MRGLTLRDPGFLGALLRKLIMLDPAFDTGSGFNSVVNLIALQADGKILVGGFFNAYNGVTQNYIARLNSDGSLDTSFNIGSGFNSDVRSIAIQADGKILVGGLFLEYNGVTQNRIARLNSDGSLDTSFVTGSGFNNSVFSIALQADGKILAGGQFTVYNDVIQRRIARLNTDGSLDTSFVTGDGFNNGLYSIALQADGKIVVGGFFTAYNGVTQNRIARLNSDGSLDTSFVTGDGFNDTVLSIVPQADGKIIVGGFFNEYNGTSTGRGIARLNPNGSLDTSFVTGTSFNSGVYSIVLQADGKILVGGQFTTYNGALQGGIARLNPNGSLDTSFNISSGFNSAVLSIALQADGKILAGGQFTAYNGVTQQRIARLLPEII